MAVNIGDEHRRNMGSREVPERTPIKDEHRRKMGSRETPERTPIKKKARDLGVTQINVAIKEAAAARSANKLTSSPPTRDELFNIKPCGRQLLDIAVVPRVTANQSSLSPHAYVTNLTCLTAVSPKLLTLYARRYWRTVSVWIRRVEGSLNIHGSEGPSRAWYRRLCRDPIGMEAFLLSNVPVDEVDNYGAFIRVLATRI